jgi:heat shock protein HslJ
LTGSVSDVKGSEIVKSPQPNLSNSLAGRFSGFIANNRGGEPGYDGSSYTIRGLASTGKRRAYRCGWYPWANWRFGTP